MRWWDREDPALVGPDHLPAALMDVPVMAIAELDQILEVGVPAVSPVEDVVGVGPRRGTLAARPDAALVAHPERGTSRSRGHPERPAHVDHRGIGTEENPANARVTGEPLHRRRRDRPGELELPTGRPGEPHHGFHRGGELEMGAIRPTLGGEAVVEGMHGELDEAVGEAAGTGRSSPAPERAQSGPSATRSAAPPTGSSRP